MFRAIFIILILLLFTSISDASHKNEQTREKHFCLHVEKRSEEAGTVTHCSLCEEPGNAERVLISCEHCGGQVHGDCVRSGAYRPICPTVGCEKPIQLISKESISELPENQMEALEIAKQQAMRVTDAIQKHNGFKLALEQIGNNSEATPILENMIEASKLEIQQLLQQLYALEYKFNIHPKILKMNDEDLSVILSTVIVLLLIGADYAVLHERSVSTISNTMKFLIISLNILTVIVASGETANYFKAQKNLTYTGSFKDILNRFITAPIPEGLLPNECSEKLLVAQKQNQTSKPTN